jgi:chromosome partitioning protein
MTVFDPLDPDLLGGLPSMSHVSARQEYRNLADALNLPTNDAAAQRRAAVAEWSRVVEPDAVEQMAPGE